MFKYIKFHLSSTNYWQKVINKCKREAADSYADSLFIGISELKKFLAVQQIRIVEKAERVRTISRHSRPASLRSIEKQCVESVNAVTILSGGKSSVENFSLIDTK